MLPGSLHTAALLHQSQQERLSIERVFQKDGHRILHNVIMEKTSHHLYQIPLIGSKSQVAQTLKRRRLHKRMNTGDDWGLS